MRDADAGRPYKLAIFDFDGTLADSAAWLWGVVGEVADRFGFRAPSEADYAVLRGQDGHTVMRHLGVPAWKLPRIAAHMRALAARDAGQIRLFPGAGETLRRLHAGGVALAVVSSNAEANVRRVLGPEHAALIGRYECGAALFGKAARFRRVLLRCGVVPADALCIGDELRDLQAARAAGVAFGAVSWGYAAPDVLRAHGAAVVFGAMEEIAAEVLDETVPAVPATPVAASPVAASPSAGARAVDPRWRSAL